MSLRFSLDNKARLCLKYLKKKKNKKNAEKQTNKKNTTVKVFSALWGCKSVSLSTGSLLCARLHVRHWGGQGDTQGKQRSRPDPASGSVLKEG